MTIITKTSITPTKHIKYIPCKTSTIPTEREVRLVQQGRNEVAKQLHDLIQKESLEACHDACKWSDDAEKHPDDPWYREVANKRREYHLGTNHCIVTLRNWCKDNGLEVR